MTEFGQGMIVGGMIGILCGVVASAFVVSCIMGWQAGARRDRSKYALKYLKGGMMVLAAAAVAGCGTTSVTKIEIRERIDSVFIKGDTVRVVDARSDTVRVVEGVGFESVWAELDTTLGGVTLAANYRYPPDTWTIEIIERDTVIRYVARDSIVQRPYPVLKVPVWVYFTLAATGIALVVFVLKELRR